jgi:hypothetical protein
MNYSDASMIELESMESITNNHVYRHASCVQVICAYIHRYLLNCSYQLLNTMIILFYCVLHCIIVQSLVSLLRWHRLLAIEFVLKDKPVDLA